ncbi:response regulator [Miniphocaeibacter halophilus]|uniref:Response regulator transcription factor n=1 Tax=Miniphocaeibacter halophilus TaxID=2931922 RepID=A0AC61MQ96_9FIRM|nr:response regulator transcription factor [Miniphocaeibacter halophilus]QQK07850.1 response regulator transcription factor [Miniphocaeibacter halophilus]
MNIIIIDDDKMITYALKTIVESDREIEVVGIGYGYEDAISFLEKEIIDIALLDIRMGDKTGIDILEYINNKNIATRVLFLTTFLDDEYIKNALSLGAYGYILKDDFENIIPAIKAVNAGQKVFGSNVLNTIYNESVNKKEISKILTEKELIILKEVAEGLNNKEISNKLYLSEGTIRNYISSILEKLDLRDRTQLAIYYLNNK